MRIKLLIGLVCGVFIPLEAFSEESPWKRQIYLDSAARESEKISVVPIEFGQLRGNIPALACVTKDVTRSFPIRPSGNGKITNISVTSGQHVVTGQTLITYTNHTLQALQREYSQMRAAYASAQANVLATDLAYKRGVRLGGKAISIAELQQRFAARQQAEATLANDQTALKIMEYRLKNEFTSVTEKFENNNISQLISPVSGVVGDVQASAGSDIIAGTVVVTVNDYSRLWITAQIRPEEVDMLEVGGRMSVRRAGRNHDEPLYVSITTIDSAADPQTGLVRVISVIDNQENRFHPGEMLDAVLEKKKVFSGFIVPVSSIQDINNHKIIYTYDGKDRFYPHEIKIIVSTEEKAIISGDIEKSQKIVTNGSFSLKSAALLSDESAD